MRFRDISLNFAFPHHKACPLPPFLLPSSKVQSGRYGNMIIVLKLLLSHITREKQEVGYVAHIVNIRNAYKNSHILQQESISETRRMWENNTGIGFKDIQCEDVQCMYLVPIRVSDIAMNARSHKWSEILICRATTTAIYNFWDWYCHLVKN
jgi:hypothetical protein